MENRHEGEGSKEFEVVRSPELASRVPARDPFVSRVVVVVVIAAIAYLILAFLIKGIDVLLAAFGGLLIAVLLHAFSDYVERHTPLSYGWALTAVVVAILVILGVGGWLLAPRITEQTRQLQQDLPRVIEDARAFLGRYVWGQWLIRWVENGGIGGGGGDGGGGGTSLANITHWASYILTAIFVGLFGAANPPLYRNGFVHIFPLRLRDAVAELLGDLGYTLRWWLIGQLLSMIIIGVSTIIILWIFDIPLAIVIGLIVGLLGFVPYLGPILGAVPIALFALPEGADTLLYVLATYTAVQMLEGYVITPLIQHRMVYLPPAFTVLAEILVGVVLGLLGFIFATPLAAVVLVLIHFYRYKILGDQEAEEQAPWGPAHGA